MNGYLKPLVIIIIIIIIMDKGEGILCHSTISLAVSQRNQEKEKSSQ